MVVALHCQTSRMRSRTVLAVILTILVTFVVAACGGDGDGDGDGGEKSPTTRASTATSTSVPVFSAGIDGITRSTSEEVTVDGGKSAWVSQSGPRDGTPVLFVGGSATSATVVDLVSFLSSAQDELGIRLISVERNGFGDTPLDPSAGYQEFADTAIGVLDELDVDDFSIVAISGGGPYAQHVAASVPERVRSIHFAAAYSGTPDAGSLAQLCALNADARLALAKGYSADPASWWSLPDDAVAHRIPGFLDAAVADGERALKDPAAMAHEFELFCRPTEVDLSKVDAPAFLYYSPDDSTTPLHFDDWYASKLPNVVANRRELTGNHDEQYRHWDQILADVAWRDDPRTLVCPAGTPAPSEMVGVCLN